MESHKYNFLLKSWWGVLFLFITLSPTYTQEKIDEANYRAVYNFSYKTKPDQTEFTKTDLMYLDIGQKTTKFYSRHEQIRDSLTKDAIDKGLSVAGIRDARKGYKQGTTTVHYQYFDKKQTLTVNTYLSLGFMYKEPMPTISWTIKDDEIELSGFKCRKAIATCFGREWCVYFTSEIPLNNGPFKLWGLPGLIVRATDKDNYFQYELTGFYRLQGVVPILFKNANHSGRMYAEINKQQFLEYEKMYYKNAISFAELIQNTQFKTTEGTSISLLAKETPFIPVEL